MADRQKYRAVVDVWYWPHADKPKDAQKQKHVKAGTVTADLPAESIPWLLADGAITKVGGDE